MGKQDTRQVRINNNPTVVYGNTPTSGDNFLSDEDNNLYGGNDEAAYHAYQQYQSGAQTNDQDYTITNSAD